MVSFGKPQKIIFLGKGVQSVAKKLQENVRKMIIKNLLIGLLKHLAILPNFRILMMNMRTEIAQSHMYVKNVARHIKELHHIYLQTKLYVNAIESKNQGKI